MFVSGVEYLEVIHCYVETANTNKGFESPNNPDFVNTNLSFASSWRARSDISQEAYVSKHSPLITTRQSFRLTKSDRSQAFMVGINVTCLLWVTVGLFLVLGRQPYALRHRHSQNMFPWSNVIMQIKIIQNKKLYILYIWACLKCFYMPMIVLRINNRFCQYIWIANILELKHCILEIGGGGVK